MVAGLFLPSLYLDGVGCPIFSVDRSLALTIWNRHLENLTGFSAKDVLSQPLSAIFTDAEKDGVASALAELQKMESEATPVEFFVRSLTKKGDIATLRVKASAQTNKKGDFVGAMCFCEQVQAYAELNQAHRAAPVNGNGASSGVTHGKPVNVKPANGNGHNGNGANGNGHNGNGNGANGNGNGHNGNGHNGNGNGANGSGNGHHVVVEDDEDGHISSYQTFLDTTSSVLIELDGAMNVVEWNFRASQLTGIDRSSILGQPLLDFVSESQKARFSEALEKAQNGYHQACFSLEWPTASSSQRRSFHDGALYLSFSTSFAGYNKDHILLMGQDITDERRKSKASLQAELGLTSMSSSSAPKTSSTAAPLEMSTCLDTANAPIFGIDADGIVNEWNAATEETTGFSRDLAIGKPFLATFISPLWQETVQTLVQDALQGQQSSSFEMEIMTSSEEIKYLLVNTTARKDSSGNTVGMFCIAQDVTETAKHDRAIAEVASELRQLVDTANAPIFGIDIDGNVNEWNDKTAEVTGYTKEEAFDQPLVDSFIVPSLRESVQEVLDNALQGQGTSNYELEFRTKSDEIRYLLVNASTRRDPDGNVLGVVAVAQDVTEAAQHDRAVAAMARELRQLVDTANAPIFGIDVDGNVNEWNDKTAEITGFTGDEAFNRPLVETFIVEKLRPSVQEVMDNALIGRGTSNYELEFVTKSGEIRYLLVNATTRRDAENNIVGVVGVAQDVTEAAKHDRAVAAMANELRQLIDTANAPIFGIDVDGDVNEWNDKTAEITGFTKEEAFDCPLVETFIVPSLRQSVQEVLDNALKGKGTSNYELEFRTKSNEIRHLLVNATTRKDAENNVVGVVGVAQDVTEAVQRDRAVAGMANELRQLIDTANAPIFGIDIDGNINEWNNKTAEITGYTKEEAFDEPLVSKFIVPSLRHSVEEVMNKALAGDETSNYELEFVAKSGEIRYLLVNATTRRDPENNVVGVVGVAQDVTDDRKHAKELREMQYFRASQEAKVETERNMTAYFAHELRNPLGAIDSALSAMPDELPETARTLVKGMQLCTEFMSSIMNNLLDVRKMEEGRMTLKSSAMSLTDVLNGVHKMLLPSLRPGVAFLKVCEVENKDWVLGDGHRIQQVWTNIVTNAIKYTTSGSITLILRWEGKNVRFECADTGPGIPKSEQAKLFQRFVQRGGAPGTGLGLAIAKHLVDITGGSIRFESDPSVKPGTSCIVLMPLPVCDAPEMTVKDDTKLIETPLAFLVIDDIKMNRMMLKRRIKKGIAPNATIKEASTGEEALMICGQEKFDVIVVDQYMEEAGGVMVGTDVVFAMRRMRIESIIIGCSGNDMDEQFAEAGADWVWKKPMPSNSRIISDIRAAMAKRDRELE